LIALTERTSQLGRSDRLLLFLKIAYGNSLNVAKKNDKLKNIIDLYQISEHLQDRVIDDISNMRLAEQEHAAVNCFMEEL
jgi:hypothetical protein